MSLASPCAGTRRRGIALIWLVMTFMALIAMVGLAMDWSVAVYGKQQLQNAADAAALAGAALVKVDIVEARTAALAVSSANTIYKNPVELNRNDENSDPQGDVVIGHYDRKTSVFTPTEVSPNAMQIFARRTAETHGAVPLVFGPIFGVEDVDAWTEAIAMVRDDILAGLLVLDLHAQCSADFGGSVTINVTDVFKDPDEPGTIHINSQADPAICANGNVSIEAGTINVYGTADLGQATFDGELNEGESPIKDPLRNLPAVPWDTLPESVVPNKNNFHVQPGYHPGSIKRTGDMLTLESGIHVFDSLSSSTKSVALEITGNGGIQCVEGGGVMLYIRRGSLILEGSGGARLDPLNAPMATPEATWNGVTIFQARDNYCDATLTGGSALDLTGTLYFPNNHVKLGGGGAGYGNQLIANTLSTFGSGEIQIAYDSRFPAPGEEVFLVK